MINIGFSGASIRNFCDIRTEQKVVILVVQ